jgi:hypothetical protein
LKSLFIFLVLCFEVVEFTSAIILFTISSWASWSERPLTIGDIQEELNLSLSIKILSMAVLEEFWMWQSEVVVSEVTWRDLWDSAAMDDNASVVSSNSVQQLFNGNMFRSLLRNDIYIRIMSGLTPYCCPGMPPDLFIHLLVHHRSFKNTWMWLLSQNNNTFAIMQEPNMHIAKNTTDI